MERYDSISYDFDVTKIPEPTQTVYTTEQTEQESIIPEDITGEFVPDNDITASHLNKHTVLMFQIALCLLIGAAAFVIKSIGGEVYEKVKTQYQSLLCDTLITDTNNAANETFVNEAVDEAENRQSMR
ncbi:MAG: hypothetical protein II388_12210 [Clostridia bacterium]|nr:hypothetical protein [Clostridia bacterium]